MIKLFDKLAFKKNINCKPVLEKNNDSNKIIYSNTY